MEVPINIIYLSGALGSLLFYLRLAIYFGLARFSLVSLAAVFCCSSRDETMKALSAIYS